MKQGVSTLSVLSLSLSMTDFSSVDARLPSRRGKLPGFDEKAAVKGNSNSKDREV